ncbi:MAG: hypothetical protein K9J83_07650 [Desulfarculaceae bacterium]|nr:hypothetical protein [Desulfarculaceae bacterium]
MFENAQVGIFQTTLESKRFIDLNPAMERILRCDATEEFMSLCTSFTEKWNGVPCAKGSGTGRAGNTVSG